MNVACTTSEAKPPFASSYFGTDPSGAAFAGYVEATTTPNHRPRSRDRLGRGALDPRERRSYGRWQAVRCFDPRAARFCAIGALNRAARELLGVAGVEPAYAAEAFVLAANGRHHDSLPCINDNCGHEVIVAMFKVALAQ